MANQSDITPGQAPQPRFEPAEQPLQQDSMVGGLQHPATQHGAQDQGNQHRENHGAGNTQGKLPVDSPRGAGRSEEHTSELQSLMRISYAVFCLKKKKKNK